MPQKERVEGEPARVYLRRVMELSGLDLTGVARKSGLSSSTLTGLMGEERTKTIRMSTLQKVEKATGISLPPEILNAIQVPIAPSDRPTRNYDIPVYALIGLAGIPFYYLNQFAVDYAPRPPGIAHATRTFAVRMPDDTMDGWRRVNELVYVDPMRAVADGDHALVELVNAASPNDPNIHAIRRVVRRGSSKVRLGTWGLNPDEVEVPRTTIVSYRRVLEWPELLGH